MMIQQEMDLGVKYEVIAEMSVAEMQRNVKISSRRYVLLNLYLMEANENINAIQVVEFIGLSFARPYLMEALNLMIAKSINPQISAENPWILMFFWADLRSESAKFVNLWISAENPQILTVFGWISGQNWWIFGWKSADFVWFLSLKLENC